jgi:hypothetical protein
MPRPPEPAPLVFWRTHPGTPRCCHTCAFYSVDGYCSEFEATPPDDHANTFDACDSWLDADTYTPF